MDICSESTILVIGDLSGARKVHAAYLEQNSPSPAYRVETVDTGKEALQMVPRINPACIVLDNELPDTSGIEWLENLRDRYKEEWPWAVILLLEDAVDSEGKKALEIGASDYLFKANLVPFNLFYVIRQAIAARKSKLQKARDMDESDYLYWIWDNVEEQEEDPKIIVHRAPIIKETERVIVLDRYYPIPDIGYKKLILKSKLPTPVAHDLYQAAMMYLINARKRETQLKKRISRLEDCMRQAEQRLSMDNLVI